MSLPGESMACVASFLSRAAKLEEGVAMRAALALLGVAPLLGDTWLSGGTVAVFRGSLVLAGLIIVRGGSFEPCPATPTIQKT